MIVHPGSRLSSDIHALTILKNTIPLFLDLCTQIVLQTALYGFVDAAGSGYGRSLQLHQNNGFITECLMKIGAVLWESDMKKSSKNLREFLN